MEAKYVGPLCFNYTPGSDEWYALRFGKIPSMLAPACLGMDPWRSPRRAWKEIMNPRSESSKFLLEMKRECEPKAIDDYCQVSGETVSETGVWVRSFWPVCVASPTREVAGDGIMLLYMGKTIYRCLPLYRRVRALVQLAVTYKKFCDVVHWRNGIVSIDRVFPSGLKGLELRLSIFHKRFILTGKCPEKGEIPRWVSNERLEET